VADVTLSPGTDEKSQQDTSAPVKPDALQGGLFTTNNQNDGQHDATKTAGQTTNWNSGLFGGNTNEDISIVNNYNPEVSDADGEQYETHTQQVTEDQSPNKPLIDNNNHSSPGANLPLNIEDKKPDPPAIGLFGGNHNSGGGENKGASIGDMFKQQRDEDAADVGGKKMTFPSLFPGTDTDNNTPNTSSLFGNNKPAANENKPSPQINNTFLTPKEVNFSLVTKIGPWKCR
jgi:hypothetical protein